MDLGRRHDSRTAYTRRQLLGLRCASASKSKTYVTDLAAFGLLRYRGTRGGALTHWRQARAVFTNMTQINRDACSKWSAAGRVARQVTYNAIVFWSPSSALTPITLLHCRSAPSTSVHYVINLPLFLI